MLRQDHSLKWGSPQLVEIVRQLGQPITRSITVDGELRHGAAIVSNSSGHDRSHTLVRYEELSAWSKHEVSLAEVGRMYGEVSVIADVNGLKLGMNDRWIIAECITQGAGLVTGDRRQARLAELVGASLGTTIDLVIAD